MRVLSLFAGVGCFDLGLERAGHTVVRQIEIDPDCRRVLRKHWPHLDRWSRDDTDVRAEFFNEGEADVICAGFPCQDISQGGSGAGLSGPRSGLFWEVVRALRVVRPKFLLLENVALLLRRGLGTVLGALAESGYDTEWDCIPKAHIGAPDIRDRLWAVAYPQHPDAHGAGSHQAPLHLVGGAELFDQQERLAGPMGAPLAAALARLGPASGRGWDPEPQFPRVADRTPAAVAAVKQAGNALCPHIAEALGRAIQPDSASTDAPQGVKTGQAPEEPLPNSQGTRP